MVKLLVGKKLGMTQVFDAAGTVTPVTVIELGPCEVVQVKTEESDGYRAAQLGFSSQTAKRVSKPQIGHFKKAGLQPYRFLKEAPLADVAEGEEVKVGDRITVGDVFEAGGLVDVVGTTKGRGFSGTIRRHGFSRGPTSHGSKNIREPGSTGMHTYPGRVFKGKKMPGQFGAKQRTVKNLKVVEVDVERHRMLVMGAVPGAVGGLVFVRHAKTPPPAKKIQGKKG